MKIGQVVKNEVNNTNSIVLYKEGIFWRAYELSAYFFTEYVRKFQISKKYIKIVKTEVVHIGFPDSKLHEILESKSIMDKEIKRPDEKQIIISEFEKTSDFAQWKQSIEIKSEKTIQQCSEPRVPKVLEPSEL